MSRIGLAAAVAAIVGISLTGCSSLSMSSDSSEQPQALNFESDPPGAEVNTNQLQTCTTPCALSVPPQDQAVVITRDGYVPQTVQVTTGPPPDHHFWQHPPPTLVPNPVHVVLQPVPKHARSHSPVSAPEAAHGPTAQGPTIQGTAARFSAFPSPPPPSKQ
jgi:hypothetical protein